MNKFFSHIILFILLLITSIGAILISNYYLKVIAKPDGIPTTTSPQLDQPEVSVSDVLHFLQNNKRNDAKRTQFTSIRISKQKIDGKKDALFVEIEDNFTWKTELYQIVMENGKIKELIPFGGGNRAYFHYDVVPLSEGTFVALYSASHMGKGNLNLILLNATQSNQNEKTDETTKPKYSFPAIDAHQEATEQTAIKYQLSSEYGKNVFASELFQNGSLCADYKDVDGDGNTDVVLKGIKQIYLNQAENNTLKQEFACQFVYLYSPVTKEFAYSDVQSFEKKIS